MDLCSKVLVNQEKLKPQKAHMDILALLQSIEDSLSKAAQRQMSWVILAILAMTGRSRAIRRGRQAAGDAYHPRKRKTARDAAADWPGGARCLHAGLVGAPLYLALRL